MTRSSARVSPGVKLCRQDSLRHVVKTCSHLMTLMIPINLLLFNRTRRSKSAICTAKKFRKNGLRRVVKTCSHSMMVTIEINSTPFAPTRRSKSAICIAKKFCEKWFAAGSKDLFSLTDCNDCKKFPSLRADSRVEIRDLHCQEIRRKMVCAA